MRKSSLLSDIDKSDKVSCNLEKKKVLSQKLHDWKSSSFELCDWRMGPPTKDVIKDFKRPCFNIV